MKRITTYFFIAGGVILPRIAQITIELLAEKKGRPLPHDQRLAIREAEKALFIGQITPEVYLQRINRLANCFESSQELLVEFMKLVEVDAGAVSTAYELQQTSQVYLFSDYPHPWLEEIAPRFQLFDLFSPHQVIYPAEAEAELHLRDDIQGVFDGLQAKGYLDQGASLWVDAHPFRTSAAIRRGIDAIIYVDERRLRRELKLRKLLES